MTMMKLPANVLITRSTGGAAGTEIHIQIEDERSGCRVMELYLSLEEFAKAITASYGKATMEYYPNAPIGKMHESKDMIVPFSGASYEKDFKDKAVAALKEFEADGWKGEISCLSNHHNFVKVKGKVDAYRVTFHRFVDWPEGKPERRDEEL